MANFRTHLTGAFVISGTLGLVTYKTGLVSSEEFLMCVLIGTIGGLLPDLDSDNSVPIKIAFDLVSLAVAFALVIYWRGPLSLVSLFLLWIVGYVFMRYAVFAAFTNLTVHRGIIHSIPYVLVCALLLTCTNYYILGGASPTSWFYGFFLLLGTLIHLILDEVYSVDLMNKRLKKSFGTALKFYHDKDRYYYFGLYGALLILIVVSPPFKPFWQLLNDPLSWWLLEDAIVPKFLIR